MSIIAENSISIHVAARLIPSCRAGKETNAITLSRWIKEGAKLSDGGRLKLRATRTPGGWFTTEAWVKEFLDALTTDRNGSAVPRKAGTTGGT